MVVIVVVVVVVVVVFVVLLMVVVVAFVIALKVTRMPSEGSKTNAKRSWLTNSKRRMPSGVG